MDAPRRALTASGGFAWQPGTMRAYPGADARLDRSDRGSGLRRSGYTGPAILLDADQQIALDFVNRLLDAWRPKTMAGVWAWRIHGDY